jgi:hypothetical protein
VEVKDIERELDIVCVDVLVAVRERAAVCVGASACVARAESVGGCVARPLPSAEADASRDSRAEPLALRDAESDRELVKTAEPVRSALATGLRESEALDVDDAVTRADAVPLRDCTTALPRGVPLATDVRLVDGVAAPDAGVVGLAVAAPTEGDAPADAS